MSDYKNFGTIVEAHLSRLLSRINGKEFGIVTGFRKEYSGEENIKRNQEIISFLNSKKMGAYILEGYWLEAPDGVDYEVAKEKGSLITVQEDSILVVKPDDMDSKDFIQLLEDICSNYNQDAVLYSNGDSYFYISKDGKMSNAGSKLSLDKMSYAYSVMKKSKNVPFVFEGLRNASNIISAKAMKSIGVNSNLRLYDQQKELDEKLSILKSAKERMSRLSKDNKNIQAINNKIAQIEEQIKSLL